MTNEIITTTNQDNKKSFQRINTKTLTWTIFSYLGMLVFLGLAIWSLYYFSLSKDSLQELIDKSTKSFGDFIKAWQYTFFPWCLVTMTCLIFAVTGTIKLKNTSVGRPKKKGTKKYLSY